MTTFKAFLRILKKRLWIIIMYSAILVFCIMGNSQTNTGMTNFVETKPDMIVYDNDDSEISRKFKEYIKERSNEPTIADTKDGLSDALYYDGVDYVIYLNKGFGEAARKGEKPEIEVKSLKNINAYLAETFVNRFTGVINACAPGTEAGVLKCAEEPLKNETETVLVKKKDTVGLSNLALFFTFMNYPIIAALVFAVAYTVSSFKREMTKKRLQVSATSYRSINTKLLVYNFIIAAVLLVVYIVIAFALNGGIVFSTYGWLMIVNAIFMSIFATAFALLLTNILNSHNAILAVVNVVAIGSSFLTGVFVPMEWMPEAVVNLGRALPSFYYTTNNTEIIKLEAFDFSSLQPVLVNYLILIVSTIIVVIINNIVIRRKR